jgi:hypothetical protein
MIQSRATILPETLLRYTNDIRENLTLRDDLGYTTNTPAATDNHSAAKLSV